MADRQNTLKTKNKTHSSTSEVFSEVLLPPPEQHASNEIQCTDDNQKVIEQISKPSSANPNNEKTCQEPPYSRFGKSEKSILALLCASAGLFSTISAPIYYPALTIIEEDFNISQEMVNITVVVYFILQGLAPMLMGGLADKVGRRPIVLCSIALYAVACIGLASAQNYGEVLFLRCLQSAGISPVVAVNSGIIGDITTKAERGGYLGLMAGTQVIGSAFGALIGAGITARWGWRAIFWFLAIGSGFSLAVASFLLPETKRTVVGNGSIVPKNPVCKSPVLLLPCIKKSLHLDNPDYETLAPPQRLDLLAPLDVMRCPDVAITLLVAGLQFSTWTCHLTALSSLLAKDYKLKVAQVGLCYLPSGICTLISVVSSGKALNWNYRRRFKQHQAWLESIREELMKEHYNETSFVDELLKTESQYKFNIYKVRLEIAFIPSILSSAGFVTFGWCLNEKAPLVSVLVSSGFASLFSNCILAFSSTLAVDLFPERSSTASGCLNFSRCILSAIFVAVLSKMLNTLKPGGTFTLLAILAATSSLLLIIPIKYGTLWQHKRQQKEQQKQDMQEKNQKKLKIPFNKPPTATPDNLEEPELVRGPNGPLLE